MRRRQSRPILTYVAGDIDKLERLTDLILTLLDAKNPIPLDEIAREIPGYPEGAEARRQAFERDKKLLRGEGIEIEAVAIDGPAQFGYRINPDAFFLPDLQLSAEEQAALNLAVAAVHMGNDSGSDALRKLGISAVEDSQPIALLGDVPGLDRLFQAITNKAEVRFRYLDEARRVAPVQLRFAGGHWYLSGWARERGAARIFRVDRIEGDIALGPAGSGVPEGTVPKSVDLPGATIVRDDDAPDALSVTVRVDAAWAWRVEAELGVEAVISRNDDDSVTFSAPMPRFDLAKTWALGYLDHLVVLGPNDLVDDIKDALATSIALHTKAVSSVPEVPPNEEHGGERGRRAPIIQDRLRRLLAMLEWLASEGSASTQEVAERFSMTEKEVVAELELAACCGRPPYSPGELMDIIVDADEVHATLPDLERTRRFTASEGVAIAAAARTILAMNGADETGPLARALAKLEVVLGEHDALEVDLEMPPLFDVITEACQQGRQLEIEYLSSSRDEHTVRIIDPLRVGADQGRWYLQAFCHRAGERRTFRIDLIKEARDVGPAAHHDVPDQPLEAFSDDGAAEPATVRVGKAARWLADSIPVRGRIADGDSQYISLSVSGVRWFERLIMQASPDAEVLGPQHLRDGVRDTATRILERYR